MSRFTRGETRTIVADWWDDGEEVIIRKWSIGQRDRLFAEIMKIVGVTVKEGEDAEALGERLSSSEVKAVQVPVILAGGKSWTFADDNGKVVPMTRKWVSQLDPDDADFIAGEIWELNKGRSAEDQESFRGEPDDSDTE